MKLGTEDCVKFLVAAMPTTSFFNWKRRSKKRVGSAIVRAFENVKTGARVTVTEQGDKLSCSDGWDKSEYRPGKDWLFAIQKMEDFDAGFMVVTTEKQFWLSQHHVNDVSPDRDIQESCGRSGCSSAWSHASNRTEVCPRKRQRSG